MGVKWNVSLVLTSLCSLEEEMLKKGGIYTIADIKDAELPKVTFIGRKVELGNITGVDEDGFLVANVIFHEEFEFEFQARPWKGRTGYVYRGLTMVLKKVIFKEAE